MRLTPRPATYTTGGDQLLPMLVARESRSSLTPRGCSSWWLDVYWL
jgi:hypothetical protein